MRRISKKLGALLLSVLLILYAILGCISIYGCVAFAQRGFPGYMSGKTTFAFFDFGEQIILFLLDYLAIMALFMIIGFLTVYALSRLRKTRKAVKR